MLSSTISEMSHSRYVFISNIYVAFMLVCSAVNGICCFSDVLIIAFSALNQINRVSGVACGELSECHSFSSSSTCYCLCKFAVCLATCASWVCFTGPKSWFGLLIRCGLFVFVREVNFQASVVSESSTAYFASRVSVFRCVLASLNECIACLIQRVACVGERQSFACDHFR